MYECIYPSSVTGAPGARSQLNVPMRSSRGLVQPVTSAPFHQPELSLGNDADLLFSSQPFNNFYNITKLPHPCKPFFN